MSETPEQQTEESPWALTDSMADAMHDSWPLFRAHHPSGAYLPVGRLDGDCSHKTCGGSWPCEQVVEFLAETFDKFAEDRNLADDPGGHLAEQARRRAEENAHRIALIRDRAKNQETVQWERDADGPGYVLTDPASVAMRLANALSDINELLALIPTTAPAIQRDSDNRELAERFADQASTKAGAVKEIADRL